MSQIGFEDVTDPSTCFLVNFTYMLAEYSYSILFYAAAFCLPINVFHLLVLFRKSMRSNCIHVIMIGIAIADLYNMGYIVKNKMMEMFPGDDCTNFYWYYRVLLEQWVQRINTILRSVSAWLGVLIALIRVLVVMFPMNSSFDSLSTAWFGVKSNLLTLLATFLLTMSEKGKYRITNVHADWFPEEKCGHSGNYSEPRYQYDSEGVFLSEFFVSGSTYMILVGVGKMIPAVMLPILAYLLLRVLHQADLRRTRVMVSERNSGSKINHTTKMILLMTIASMIAEGPLGVLACLHVISDFDQKATDIFYNLENFFNVLVVLNTVSNCFICLILSSQYKTAAKEMFVCGVFRTATKSPQQADLSNRSGASTVSRGALVRVE